MLGHSTDDWLIDGPWLKIYWVITPDFKALYSPPALHAGYLQPVPKYYVFSRSLFGYQIKICILFMFSWVEYFYRTFDTFLCVPIFWIKKTNNRDNQQRSKNVCEIFISYKKKKLLFNRDNERARRRASNTCNQMVIHMEVLLHIKCRYPRVYART